MSIKGETIMEYRMTVHDLINFLQSLPEEKKKYLIYVNLSCNKYLEKNDIYVSDYYEEMMFY